MIKDDRNSAVPARVDDRKISFPVYLDCASFGVAVNVSEGFLLAFFCIVVRCILNEENGHHRYQLSIILFLLCLSASEEALVIAESSHYQHGKVFSVFVSTMDN